MKYFTILFFTLALASPASAITWKEFWEPFDGGIEHHHYYHRPKYKKICYHNVPVKVYRGGVLVNQYYETVREPCWKKYRDHHHH